MTVKAVAIVTDINPHGTTGFDAAITVVGIDSNNSKAQFTVSNIDPTLTQGVLEAAIKQATKDYMTNNFGYTWGLFDSVRLLNFSLL